MMAAAIHLCTAADRVLVVVQRYVAAGLTMPDVTEEPSRKHISSISSSLLGREVCQKPAVHTRLHKCTHGRLTLPDCACPKGAIGIARDRERRTSIRATLNVLRSPAGARGDG